MVLFLKKKINLILPEMVYVKSRASKDHRTSGHLCAKTKKPAALSEIFLKKFPQLDPSHNTIFFVLTYKKLQIHADSLLQVVAPNERFRLQQH